MALSIRDRRTQLMLAGGVVGILAIYLALKVVGGGGSESVTSTTPSFSAPAPSIAPTPSPTPPGVVVFSGRDPFQDLFGAGTSTAPIGGTTTTPPIGGTTTTPPSFGTSTPPPSGGGNGDGPGSSTTIGGHSVLLDDIFVAQGGVRKAQVEVDGTVYTVAAGQSFDDNFMLVSFPNASCAHFVFGDEGFTLCTSGGK